MIHAHPLDAWLIFLAGFGLATLMWVVAPAWLEVRREKRRTRIRRQLGVLDLSTARYSLARNVSPNRKRVAIPTVREKEGA